MWSWAGLVHVSVCVQNPRNRISLPDIMRHPWVTMSGQFPLKSTRELKGEETQERHAGLAHGRTFAEVGHGGATLKCRWA